MVGILPHLRCRLLAGCLAILISQPAFAVTDFDHFVFQMTIADNMFPEQTGPSYGELRENFFDKIAAAKARGDQATVDRLLAEEDQFQRMAGRLLAITGQPPIVARWLGIRTDTWEYNFPFASAYDMGEGLVNANPEWLSERPEYCRQPVLEHLAALRNYQDTQRTISTDFLTIPGGEFYEAHRLYDACRSKNYAEFDRLVALRAARAAGDILPELEPVRAGGYREKGTIYFGEVPDDYTPVMPEPQVVAEKLAQDDVREVRLLMNKQADGMLIEATVTPFVASVHMRSGDFDQCINVPRAERTEKLRRVCDDQYEMYRYQPYILLCGYRATRSERLAPEYALYWWHERVSLVTHENLLRRDRAHPLLVMRDARTACPATKTAAEETQQSYRAKLDNLRQQYPQIPMTERLPDSEWVVAQREASRRRGEALQARIERTEAYSWPGYYALEFTQTLGGRRGRTRGASNVDVSANTASGDCIVAENPDVPTSYRAACWTDRQVSAGKSRKAHGYTLDLNLLPPNRFLLEPDSDDTLSSTQGVSIRLTRKSDVTSFGAFPLEGQHLLMLAKGDDILRALCTVSAKSGWYSLQCADSSGRRLQGATRIRSGSYAKAQMITVTSLLYTETFDDKYHRRLKTVTLDGTPLDRLFFVIDPRFSGDEIENASLMAFANGGITGSMQRIQSSDVQTSDVPSRKGLTGRWVGELQCEPNHKREAELHLIEQNTGGFRTVSGKFVFRDTARNDGGAYGVHGEYLADTGAFVLRADDWVGNPLRGYNAVDFWGASLWPEGDAQAPPRIVGDGADRYCAALTLTRISATAPELSGANVARPVAQTNAEPATVAVAPAETTAPQAARCELANIAGAYSSSYGTMNCTADGEQLNCCYAYSGEQCTKQLQLKLAADRQSLSGKWAYSNGTTGVAEFGLDDSCSLSDGRWGYSSLTSGWSVSGRAQSQ